MSVAIKECKRCIRGNVLPNYGISECLQCGTEHDQDGNLIPHPIEHLDLRKDKQIWGWHKRRK